MPPALQRRRRHFAQYQPRYAGFTAQVPSADTGLASSIKVLAGIEAARAQKISPESDLNAVILRGSNEQDILPLLDLCRRAGVSTLPLSKRCRLGQVNARGQATGVCSQRQTSLQAISGSHHDLQMEHAAHPNTEVPLATGSVDMAVPSRLGLISPHSNNFCASCNRLRVTAEGQLLLCLGNEHAISLRDLLREWGIRRGVGWRPSAKHSTDKPEQHVFAQPDQPQIMRFMNASGG